MSWLIDNAGTWYANALAIGVPVTTIPTVGAVEQSAVSGGLGHVAYTAADTGAVGVMCLAFPVIGLFMGMMAAAVVWGSPSAAGQGGPPRGGGPGQPGPAPDQPGGGWRVAADGGVERLTACPFPDPGRDDDEDRSDLVDAAARGPMTRTR